MNEEMTPEEREQQIQLAAATSSRGVVLSAGIAAAKADALRNGRPSMFDPDVAAAICKHIQDGKSVQSYCLRYGMNAGTIYAWMSQQPSFAADYSRAHMDRADTLVDDMLQIADDLEVATDIVQVMAAKVRIDTRKWIAERMRPEKYGAKLQIEQKAPVTFQMGIPKRQVKDIIDVIPVQSAPSLPAKPHDSSVVDRMADPLV